MRDMFYSIAQLWILCFLLLNKNLFVFFVKGDESLGDSTLLKSTQNEGPENSISHKTGYTSEIDGENDDEKASKILSRRHRSVTVRKKRTWEHGIIPYEMSSYYTGKQKTTFKQAMQHWENFTCIQFVERIVEKHPNYVMFEEQPCGCCSNIGKRGKGMQFISINEECSEFGIVVHEIGHAIGFYHEHTRPDRDNYVKIIEKNVQPDVLYNFDKLNKDKIEPLNQPYDHHSIMHYASNTFSIDDNLNTIIPEGKSGVNPSELGQRIKLSEGDIYQANYLYNCPKCGATFQKEKGLFGSPIYSNLKDFPKEEYCEWRISAAHGEKIVFTVKTLNIYKSPNCKNDYLEITDGYDINSPILGHICGRAKSMKAMISSGNRAVIKYKRTNKDLKYNGFTARYEVVCGGDIFINNNTVDYLESPNYPQSYAKGKECIWRISVTANQKIVFEFSSFDLKPNKNTKHDYLEIRDGHEINSSLIGHYSSSSIPPTSIKSAGNKLLIKFVSNDESEVTNSVGFSAVMMPIN